jgi:acyl-CoA synthetase (AMP-forming)/AMP-acid ligase II
MFHAAAAVQSFFYGSTGSTVHLLREFEPGEVLRVLREQRIAVTTLAPAMIQLLLEHPDVARSDYLDLQYMLYGAAPIASDVLRRAMATFGCGFFQAYGMTETTTSATMLNPTDHLHALEEAPHRLLSCGRPLLGTAVRVVDSEDKDVDTGTPGEVIVAGPQLMTEYWHRPEATAEALRGGWMHTGDIGHLDEDGYLFISDRLKDMIVSGGENIYPREIEDVLFGLDGVTDAAVIGIPDERWGESPLAFVVRRSGSALTADEVVTHCRSRLASYKCPRRVEFVDTLPRNATGKVLKFELREPFWKGRQRSVN